MIFFSFFKKWKSKKNLIFSSAHIPVINPGQICIKRGVTLKPVPASYKLAQVFFIVPWTLKKSPRPYPLRVLRNSILNFQKNVYITKKIFVFFSFFISLSDRKSCEDHESPPIYGSTTLSFWVIAILKSIFLDLVFFWKIFGSYFSNFWIIFF